jgi:hypothetical protein
MAATSKRPVQHVFWGLEYVLTLALAAALGAEMTTVIKTTAAHAATGFSVRLLALLK